MALAVKRPRISGMKRGDVAVGADDFNRRADAIGDRYRIRLVSKINDNLLDAGGRLAKIIGKAKNPVGRGRANHERVVLVRVPV